MLTAFSKAEGFSQAEEFLKEKNIVVLGKGRTAGAPTIRLLQKKGFNPTIIDLKTQHPNEIIRQANVVISATGRKHIINGSNIKNGAYVIGVGLGREIVEGQEKVYGDINDDEVSKKAKFYCPTIGGIGPLTVASLLSNVVVASKTITHLYTNDIIAK